MADREDDDVKAEMDGGIDAEVELNWWCCGHISCRQICVIPSSNQVL